MVEGSADSPVQLLCLGVGAAFASDICKVVVGDAAFSKAVDDIGLEGAGGLLNDLAPVGFALGGIQGLGALGKPIVFHGLADALECLRYFWAKISCGSPGAFLGSIGGGASAPVSFPGLVQVGEIVIGRMEPLVGKRSRPAFLGEIDNDLGGLVVS